MRTHAGPGATAAEAVERLLRETATGPDEARRARQALRAEIEAQAADLPERQSLRWMGTELEYGGDFFGDVPDGGYQRITGALAERLDVRLGSAVTDVVLSAGGVELRCAEGGSFSGTHAVITVPLGVLKRGSVRFSPPLPPDHLNAAARLGFGMYEKVALTFEQPFWSKEGLSHQVFFPKNRDEVAVWMVDHAVLGAGPALTFHMFHSTSVQMRDAEPESRKAITGWALDLLAGALGRPCPPPRAVAVSSWATDAFSSGSYAHIPPGSGPEDVDILGRPVGGRLLFAGEHTYSPRLGYADGALSSGIREAMRACSVLPECASAAFHDVICAATPIPDRLHPTLVVWGVVAASGRPAPRCVTTSISPGYVRTELADSIDDPDSRAQISLDMDRFAIAPQAVAAAIAFAIEQPHDVEISDLTIRPTVQA